jgi:type IV pilus assembly protein PilO
MAKSFHDLSARSQMIVLVVVCALVVVGSWQVLLGPEQADLATQRTRLASVQAEVARAQATAAKLPALERDIQKYQTQLQQTTAVLPDEKDPQDVLRNLHDLASESALTIASFTPKPIVAKAQYSEWPITLGLEGDYHDLGRFFDRIASMARLMSVSDLEIKAQTKPNDLTTVTASCVATTFVFKKDLAPAETGGKQ